MGANPITVLVINTDDTYEIKEIKPDLKTVQSIVGGYAQAVPTPWDDNGHGPVQVWCNEEGKLIGLPINHAATMLWWHLDREIARQDVLAGPVFITGGRDGEELRSCPDKVIDVWRKLVGANLK